MPILEQGLPVFKYVFQKKGMSQSKHGSHLRAPQPLSSPELPLYSTKSAFYMQSFTLWVLSLTEPDHSNPNRHPCVQSAQDHWVLPRSLHPASFPPEKQAWLHQSFHRQRCSFWHWFLPCGESDEEPFREEALPVAEVITLRDHFVSRRALT